MIDCSSSRNNCFLLKDGSVATILNIIESEDGSVYLIGKKHTFEGPLYTTPCNSNDYNIQKIINSSNKSFCSWPLSEVKSKMWKISETRKVAVVFPVLHITSC